MLITVGSLNPVKIGAVESVARKIWPAVKVQGVRVASGVSSMPMSDDECLLGARNRARKAREISGADVAFGLEGGVNNDPSGLMLIGWAAMVDAAGRESVGGGARLALPPTIANRILAGEELGPVMDELLGEKNVRQKGGAVGALTGGIILRQDTFAIAVAYALSPLLAPQFYE